MSRFYSKITPDKKSTMTRTSHRTLIAEVLGWNSGVKVEAFINAEGKDAFRIFKTSGSDGLKHDKLIGIVSGGEFTREVPTPHLQD